jgi:hypothetical protein
MGLMVVELKVLLIEPPREGAEAEARGMVGVLAIFVRGLAVEAADANLDPDEEAGTVFFRVVVTPDVPLAAAFSAFSFIACFSREC